MQHIISNLYAIEFNTDEVIFVTLLMALVILAAFLVGVLWSYGKYAVKSQLQIKDLQKELADSSNEILTLKLRITELERLNTERERELHNLLLQTTATMQENNKLRKEMMNE